MIVLRSLLYQLLFNALSLVLAVIFLPALILPFAAILAAARLWSASIFFLLRWTVGLTYRIEGEENIPDGPVIFASKHQSAWDTMIFPYVLDAPAIVVKKELHMIPFYGWFAARYGTIGIDRKSGASALRKMIVDCREAIGRDRSIVIFPEGTRTPPGERQTYQSGVVALYRDLKVPVVPVALNSGLFWPRRSMMRKPGVITLRYLPAIPPGLDRRDFMRRLEDEVEAAQMQLPGLKNESEQSPT
jgi:1-acyl-sn-glycerol-3-phosphate acyltransferase